jgi:hypothetical protein
MKKIKGKDKVVIVLLAGIFGLLLIGSLQKEVTVFGAVNGVAWSQTVRVWRWEK